MRLTNLLNELKQRNVFRVATLYAVTAWVIIEFVGLVFPMFGIPLWTQRLIVIVLLAGFPVALILSWVFRTIPEKAEGQPATDGDELTVAPQGLFSWRTLSVVLFISIAVLLVWQFRIRSSLAGETLPSSIRSEKVAVSIFNNFTGDDNLDALGNMASDWITSGLRELGVQTSSPEMMRRYVEYVGILPGNAVGETSLFELTDARYVLTGSYYKSGDSIQLNTRLESTQSGDVVYEFPIIWGGVNEKEIMVSEIRDQLMGYWAVSTSHKSSTINPPKYEAYQAFLKTWMFDKRELKRIVQLDSTFILARIYLAYVAAVHRDYELYEENATYIQEHWDQCTEFEKNYFRFAQCGQTNKYEEGLEWMEKNHQLDPRDYDIIHHTAYDWFMINHLEEAADRYELIFNNDSIESYRGISGNMRDGYLNVMLRLGKYDEVTGRLARQLNLSMHNGTIMLAYLLKGDLEAVRNFVKEEDPKAPIGFAHNFNMVYPSEQVNPFAENLRRDLDEFDDPVGDWNYLIWSNYHLYNRSSKAYAFYVLKDWEAAEQSLLRLKEQDIDWIALAKGAIPQSMTHDLPRRMDIWINGLLGCTYARQAKKQQALAQIEILDILDTPALPIEYRMTRGVVSYWQARIYAILGEKAKAVDKLTQSFEEGRCMDYGSFWYDWDLVGLKGYESFEEFMRPR